MRTRELEKLLPKYFEVLILIVIPAPDAHGCANAVNTRMCKNSASRNPLVLNLTMNCVL
jgi:hypothetical protein